jgi:hypothetical protein
MDTKAPPPQTPRPNRPTAGNVGDAAGAIASGVAGGGAAKSAGSAAKSAAQPKKGIADAASKAGQTAQTMQGTSAQPNASASQAQAANGTADGKPPAGGAAPANAAEAAQPNANPGLELPKNNTVNVVKALSEGNLTKTIDQALNSPGDSMTLSLEGHGSVGAGLNVGIKGGVEAQLTRTADGKYEMSIDKSVALTGGAEVVENVEANVAGGGSVKQIYSYNTPAEAAQGLRSLAITQAAGPGGEIAARVGNLQSKVAQGMTAETSTLGQLNRMGLKGLGKAALGPAASLIPGVNKAINNGVDRAMNQANKAAQQVDRITGEVANARNNLNQHLTAVEVKAKGEGSFRAKIGGEDFTPAAGLSLGNTESGAGGGVSKSTTMRYNLPKNGKPGSVELTRSYDGRLDVEGRLGGGAGAKLSGGIDLKETYQRTANGFSRTESTATLRMDAKGDVSGGVGASVNAGIGRSVSIEVDRNALQAAGTQAVREFLNGNPQGVVDALGDTPLTAKWQDRVDLGVNSHVGYSVAGNGGYVDVNGAWSDAGPERSVQTTFGDASSAFWQTNGAVIERAYQDYLRSGYGY